MARFDLDAVPGVRSLRRIRRTVHSEIAENKMRLDHIGQDTAVLLEAITNLRSELAALAFALEDPRRKVEASRTSGDAGGLVRNLDRLEGLIRELGERLVSGIEAQDQQSLSRLSSIRRELVSLHQSWDWTEHRPPDGEWILQTLCSFLAPLLHEATLVERVSGEAPSLAAALTARGIELADGGGTGPPEAVGLIHARTNSLESDLLDGLEPTHCEVLVTECVDDDHLSSLRLLATAHGLRRWIILLHRDGRTSFDVNVVSLGSADSGLVVFFRDRDTFIAAADWCSRNVARESLMR